MKLDHHMERGLLDSVRSIKTEGKKVMTYDLGTPVTFTMHDLKSLRGAQLTTTYTNTNFFRIAWELQWPLETYLQRLLST